MNHKVNICGVDTSSIPKLGKGEFEGLMTKIKAGDKLAEDYFILANMRLVLSVVQRFKNKGNSDDLFQVGCVGLLKAIKYFDMSYNVRFSTYAVPMILGEIRRFMRDETSIKVSRRIRDTAYKALKCKEIFERDRQSVPSMMEIASELDLDIREVACALDAVSEPVSIFDTGGAGGEERLAIIEQLFDIKNNDDNWIENVSLKSAINELPEKERTVLELRYYIGRTQIEISDEIGISQAQVSRLEKNAIDKLRKAL